QQANAWAGDGACSDCRIKGLVCCTLVHSFATGETRNCCGSTCQSEIRLRSSEHAFRWRLKSRLLDLRLLRQGNGAITMDRFRNMSAPSHGHASIGRPKSLGLKYLSRSRYFGCHSRASFCASASCSGDILAATKSRFLTASLRLRAADAGKRAAARLNHMCALTLSCSTPSPVAEASPRLYCAWA